MKLKVMGIGEYGYGFGHIGDYPQHYGYSLTEPIKKDGSFTRYAQFIVAIAAGITKKTEILDFAGYTGGSPAARRGHHCSTFTALKAADLIRYDRKAKGYVLGDQHAHWHRNFLVPALLSRLN